MHIFRRFGYVYTVLGYWTNLEPDNIRPFSPVYTKPFTQIRSVRGSQIRPVPWFLCKRNGQNGQISAQYQLIGIEGTTVPHCKIYIRFNGGQNRNY